MGTTDDAKPLLPAAVVAAAAVKYREPHIKFKDKYHTENKKRDKSSAPPPSVKHKYATEPKDPRQHCHYNNLVTPHYPGCASSSCACESAAHLQAELQKKKSKTAVSLVAQTDYMRRHLYIKSGVDREQKGPGVRYQAKKKVSFRNYTPKAIDQELNMGMWI